jgi:hypothetical protein
MLFKTFILTIAASQLVAGHGAIIKATGDAGGAGQALGVVDSTPRDGTRRDPFQQDSTRFRGASAATCGETVGAGANSIDAGTKAIMAKAGMDTMPQISAGGSVDMTIHQVNGDGAGPYTCEIDATGTGTNWQPMQVTTNVPGSNSRSDARAQDFPLAAAVPAGQDCTGTVAGQNNVCMVRCMNAARAGPFGGCVPVQMGGAAAGNGTAAAAAPKKAAAKKTTRRSAKFLA